MPSGSIVQLIPWDPESDQHTERLTQQREQCGWHQDIVESVWKAKQLSGKKCIYWIVSHAILRFLDQEITHNGAGLVAQSWRYL